MKNLAINEIHDFAGTSHTYQPLVAHPTSCGTHSKSSMSVVQTVLSVYGLASRDYRRTGLGSMGILTTAVWRLILKRFVTLVG